MLKMIITPESTTRELVIESSSESKMIQVPECTQSHGGCSGNSGSNHGGLVVVGGLERERVVVVSGSAPGLCEKKVITSQASFVHHNHHDAYNVKDIVVTSNHHDKFHQPSTDKLSTTTQLKKDEDLNLGKFHFDRTGTR